MDTAGSINILIADDHQMIIDGISDMLAAEPAYTVAGTAPDGSVALEMILANPQAYQVLLTDVSMPILSGIDLCRAVKAAYPHIQVLVLSMYSSATAVQEAVMAEADGYILKNSGKRDLLTALHRITGGGTYFSEAILPIIYGQYQKAKTQSDLARLTTREQEILTLIVKEQTSEEIAATLFISKKTVDTHRANILEKTGSKTTVGLVKWAIKNGLE